MAASTNVGSIHYDLKLDTKNFDKNSKQATKNVESFGSRMKGFAVKAGIATAAIGGAGFAIKKGLIDPASDLTETINKVDVAFGDNAQQIKDWSKETITSIGLAGSTAMETASLFGDMGTSMGISQGDAADMSMSLTGLAGDLASFKNIGVEQATTALAGVFTGETESLKKLGIVMTQTQLEQFAMNEGIEKSIKDMTQAEKVNLRYAFVMDKTKNAQGDFANTLDSAANQTRVAGERAKELREEIGQRLTPVYMRVLQAVNWLMAGVRNLLGWIDRNRESFQAIGQSVQSFVMPIMRAIGQVFKNIILPALQQLWEVFKTQLLPSLKELWKQVKPVLLPVLKVLGVILGGVLVAAIWGTIKALQIGISVMSKLINAISAVIRFFKRLVRFFTNGTETIKNTVRGALTLIIVSIYRFGRRFFDAGKGLLTAFGNGIKNAAKGVKDKVDNVLQSIRNKLPFSDAKEGALSDLTLSGKRFAETFAGGIAKGAESITRAVDNSLATPAAMLGAGQRAVGATTNNLSTSVYGDINIKNRRDAEFFIEKLTRNQELLSFGAAETVR